MYTICSGDIHIYNIYICTRSNTLMIHERISILHRALISLVSAYRTVTVGLFSSLMNFAWFGFVLFFFSIIDILDSWLETARVILRILTVRRKPNRRIEIPIVIPLVRGSSANKCDVAITRTSGKQKPTGLHSNKQCSGFFEL